MMSIAKVEVVLAWVNDARNNIDGGADDDTLTGGSYADSLIGGQGNDTLNGGGVITLS
jgi:Ca2+-binding RTX toxin-like protein